VKVAFYAPLKHPGHPVPSGDRRVARLLLAALGAAGHEAVVASTLASRDGRGDAMAQAAIAGAAAAEVERLTAALAADPPDAWLTYHLYYKAPDLIGPAVADALGLPYLVAEPSVAMKRAGGSWDAGHRATLAALARADAVLCPTRYDIVGIWPHLRADARLYYLPPFLDRVPELVAHPGHDGVARLLAVGMMRAGDKLGSYRALGQALERLPGDPPWRLTIVGDGPARGEVEAAFAAIASRVDWAGAVPPDALPALYAAADLYVWPGVGEAYGMATLEAQAAGLPVVAGHLRGLPDVVADGISGRLVPPDDPQAFADAVAALIADPAARARLGAAGRARVAAERTVTAAARILDDALRGAAR
jgi:glycosyltransferase involved in cell wall biosynthesis